MTGNSKIEFKLNLRVRLNVILISLKFDKMNPIIYKRGNSFNYRVL
jgi:hypothetical protein